MSDETQVETQVATPETPVAPETPAPEATPETPPRTYTQKELDEIVGKVKENQRRRREELRRDLDVFKRMAMERQATPQTPQQAQPSQTQAADDPQKPKQENFADYNEYTEAVAEWKAEIKIREREATRAQEEARARQQAALQQAHRSHAERENAAREKYEDYDEVALGNVPINDVMANTIINSEIGPEIAYYLGKNVAEARRIAGLPPIRAVVELGKIEAKLEAQAAAPAVPVKAPSAAPAPITPVGGKATPATSDDPSDRDDIGTWIAKRNKQVHGKR